MTGAAIIVIDNGLSFVIPKLSVTLKVITIESVAVEGVPDIIPLSEFKNNPTGRVPDVVDQLKGGVPPEAARVCE
jgi:hypothetical protein